MNKRVECDIKLLRNNKYVLEILENDTIHVFTTGPDDSPYSNTKLKVLITFSEEYPFKSPSVGFVNKIWHPNVDYNSGSICLNVLNQEWSPIYSCLHIIETFIPQLLLYPNPEDPLNAAAARLFLDDKIKYFDSVRNNTHSSE